MLQPTPKRLDQLLASIETPLDDDDLPPHSQPTGGLGKAAHDAAAASWTSYQPGETRHKTGHFPAEVNIKPGTRHTEPQHELRKPTEMFVLCLDEDRRRTFHRDPEQDLDLIRSLGDSEKCVGKVEAR